MTVEHAASGFVLMRMWINTHTHVCLLIMSVIGQPAKKNLVFKLLFKGEGNFKHVVQQLY